MSGWYCKLDGREAGPFAADELEFLFERGQIDGQTLIRRESDESWARAEERLPDWFPPADAADVSAAVAESATLAEPEPTEPVDDVFEQPSAADRVVPGAGQDTESQRRRKQAAIGAGIGTVAALLICLLLLLLLAFGTLGRRGQGIAGMGGRGTGPGAGMGHGSGTGTGAGSGAGEGAGGDLKATGGGGGRGSPSPAGESASGSGAGGDRQGQAGSADGGGSGDEGGTARTREFAVTEAPEPVPQVSGGTAPGRGPDDGASRLAGGGGGSDFASFVGVRAGGSKFVYVIDCSSSMRPDRLIKAKAELVQSLKQLKPSQKAYVFFFSQTSYPMFAPYDTVETKLLPCSKPNVQRMETWIDNFDMSGGTDPRQSLLDALDLAPDAIFFLTDGQFAAGIADDVRIKNHTSKRPVSINTICFVDRAGEPLMKQIAAENKGDYRFVP
jgi:hypothetical protein